MNARKVVYVSCDVATLARDARRFVDAGYEVESINAFDLFPNTPHVETVVVCRGCSAGLQACPRGGPAGFALEAA